MSAGFYQFETVDIEITLDKEDVLVDAKDIVVSIVQSGTRLDIHKDELGVDEETSTLSVHLSQEQASKFAAGKAMVQVNVLYESAERDVSAQGELSIFTNLYRQVMS